MTPISSSSPCKQLHPPTAHSATTETSSSEKSLGIFYCVPDDVMLELFEYISPKELINLMLLNQAFQSLINGLLKDNPSKPFSRIEAQRDWSAKKIKAISTAKGLDALTHAEMIEKIKMKLAAVRHIALKISHQSVNFDRFLVAMDAVSDRGHINKSVQLNVFLTKKYYSDAIINGIVKILASHSDSGNVEISLYKNEFNTENISVLGRSFNKSISKFFSKNNEFGDDGVLNISPHLKETSINEFALEYANISNQGVKYLIGMLPNIEELSLEGNSIDNEGLRYLVHALESNTKIKKINLSNLYIEDGGIEDILILLKKGVRIIYLYSNNISNAGAHRLLSALKNIEKDVEIEHIDLTQNYNVAEMYERERINKNGKFIEIIGGPST